MAELGDGIESSDGSAKKPEVKVNGSSIDGGRRSATPGLDHEGEKERTLAQAALSVAEISEYINSAY